MATNGPSLSGSMKANLVRLHQTASLLERTQRQLAAGREVTSAVVKSISYSTDRGRLNREGDLDRCTDQATETMQRLKTIDAGIKTITELVTRARSLAQSAKRSTDAAVRWGYVAQFDEVRARLGALADGTGDEGPVTINRWRPGR